jgi:hypothetical protein
MFHYMRFEILTSARMQMSVFHHQGGVYISFRLCISHWAWFVSYVSRDLHVYFCTEREITKIVTDNCACSLGDL